MTIMTETEKLIKEYLDYLEIEKNRSPRTRANYGRYLAEFVSLVKPARVKDITADAVREFRITLAHRNLKKNTQSYYVIAIRNFLKYLIRRGIAALSPETVELPKVSRQDIEVLSYEELERILAVSTRLAGASAKREKGNPLRILRDRAILETLFSTGLRLSELCALSRYLDLARGELSVRGKGDKLRVVFFSEGAKKAIKEYLAKRTDTDEALFVSLDKKGNVIGRVTPRAVERLVEARAREAGVPKRVHPHQFRHSFATDLLINGADLRSVQELLGHANVSTTQVYTHLTNKELKEVHKTFHARRRR